MSAEYAGHGPGELVWRPGAASRSPLYLLLCLATPGGDVFVDLSGRVWTGLPDTRA